MKDVVRVNASPDRSNGRTVHMTVTGGSPALRKLDDPELVSLFASKYNIMLSTGAACSLHKTGVDAASHRVYGALGVVPRRKRCCTVRLLRLRPITRHGNPRGRAEGERRAATPLRSDRGGAGRLVIMLADSRQRDALRTVLALERARWL
jgi:hypothetical protein